MALKCSRKALLLGVLSLWMVSCSPFSSKKSPIVLILLESYSEQEYLCSDSRKLEGLTALQEVCEDFIRFTHAYAPSNLTQPNLASLMTGLPIYDHRVEHNGASGLSARLQTLSEMAINMNMRTSFFSGGIPVVHKFGLSQGVEKYDEPFTSEKSQFFRPLDQSIDLALRWVDEEVKNRSFFMTLFASDLLYKNRITQDGLDNERPLSRQSNVQEIHESINDLIVGLKKRRRWDNTHFVVVGVTGPQRSLRPFNPLSGQFLHVPLQMKLAKNLNSNIGELKTELISFDRLGRWLQKLVQYKPSQGDLIFSSEKGENFIPQQNNWAQWRSLSDWFTSGLRKKQYLFVFNPDLIAFDSYFDKNEYEPIDREEATKLVEKFDLKKQIRSYFPRACYNSTHSNCRAKKTDTKSLSQLSQLIRWEDESWASEQPVNDFDQRISEAITEKNEIIISWLAYRALYEKRWAQLFDVGKKSRQKPWMLIAQMNLRETPSMDLNNCLKYFVGENKKVKDFYKFCQDSGLRRVVEGLTMIKNKKRPSAGFWDQVNKIKNRRLAMTLNLEMLFANDVGRPFDFSPSLSELYFFLPENRDYLELIQFDKS